MGVKYFNYLAGFKSTRLLALLKIIIIEMLGREKKKRNFLKKIVFKRRKFKIIVEKFSLTFLEQFCKKHFKIN